MIRNRNFAIDSLMRLTANGLEVAEFVDIRDTLIKRYKEVYGSDIDVSTATADGVFINDLANIINNILQVNKTLYSQLDANTATGVCLDNLCRLANVTRRQATHSTASVVLTDLRAGTQGEDPVKYGDLDENGNVLDVLTLADNAGTEWQTSAVTLGRGQNISVTATCKISGSVKAPAHDINKTIFSMNLSVDNLQDAIAGNDLETDTSLRARRTQSAGAAGVTVLESLMGALYNIDGVDDVYVYNNNTNNPGTASDGTYLSPHSIYCVLRYRQGLIISDETIGQMIFNKLTPGIATNQANDEVKHSYKFVPQLMDTSLESLAEMVYWKEAVPVKPTISIKITTLTDFIDSDAISSGEAVKTWLNGLRLKTNLRSNDIIAEVLNSQSGQTKRTFFVDEVTIDNGTFYENLDTFYNYTNVQYDDDTKKITIS